MNKIRIVLLIASSFLIMGAIFGPIRTQLDYRAKTQKNVNNKDIKVYVSNVNDERESKSEIIGEAYNNYGMQLQQLMQPEEMMRKLTEIIQSEFGAAGYSIVEEGKHDMRVDAKLEEFQCSSKNITGQASIKIHFVITDKSEEVLNDSYSASEEGRGLFALSNAAYCNVAVDNAIRKLTSKFMKDMNDYSGS